MSMNETELLTNRTKSVLWTAKIIDDGKLWNTAWGWKSRAIFIRAYDNKKFALWGKAHDPDIMDLKVGQDIQVYKKEGEWKIFKL